MAVSGVAKTIRNLKSDIRNPLANCDDLSGMPPEFRRGVLPALRGGEGGRKDLHDSYFVWRDAKRLSLSGGSSRFAEAAVAPLYEWAEFGDYRDRRPRRQKGNRQSDSEPSYVGTATRGAPGEASAKGSSSDWRRSPADGRCGDLDHLSANQLAPGARAPRSRLGLPAFVAVFVKLSS